MIFKKELWNLALFISVAFSVVVLTGCSGNDGRQALSGTVMLDNQPLAEAMISFEPVSGNLGTTSGTATDSNGEFSLPAAKGLKPGKYKITIQKWKGTGRTFVDRGSGKPVEITAPISFKEAGKLSATVSADETNHIDLRLTSVK